MLTPAQLQAGREWLAECDWRDCDAEWVMDEATPADVVRNLARTFAGGWPGFLLTLEPVDPAVFGEPQEEEFVPRDHNDADGVTTMGDLQ